MSLAPLLVLFSVPCLLLLLLALYTLRALYQKQKQHLPDRSGYGWRYPGTVRGSVVHCYRCHCSRLGRRPAGKRGDIHFCSLCGTALFILKPTH